MSHKLKKRISGLLATFLWIAVWQIVAFLVGKELLLPGPLATLHALGRAVQVKTFWRTVQLSLWRVFWGFCLGTTIGVILAILSCRSWLAEAVLAPAIRMIRAVPVASFILLIQLWLKSTVLPGFIAALIVLPVVWGNCCEGIRQTDPQLLEVAQVFRFRKMTILSRIYVPSVLPYFRSACTTSLGLAWKSGIAAEVISQPKLALGTQLSLSKTYMNTDSLFAWTLVVVVLSLLVESVLRKLLQRLGGGQT